jgi:FkbM family methyltransferase
MHKTELSQSPIWLPTMAALIRILPAGRYRIMNWLSRRSAPPFWSRMPRESGGFAFHCDLSDSIAREVCFTGQYEPQDTALVKSLLGQGMTFVDVGANWGYFTLLAAYLVGSSGKIVSFEPDPRLYPILKKNVTRNDLSNVTALQLAAANEAGTLMMAGFDEDGGNHGLSRLVEHAGTTGKLFPVQTQSVDRILDELSIECVDLLKMDIEGAEELALQGMSEGLSDFRYRRILLEIHPTILAERGRTAQDVVDIMLKAGYSGWWIDFSPAAIRKAAYAHSLNPRDYLRPLASVTTLDDWPHTLWLAPGLELPT